MDITKIYLPKSLAQQAIDALFEAGTRNLEAVVLFAGIREDETFFITRTIVPIQFAENAENGLLYVVLGDELHRISLELFDSGLQLIAQIHSHPNEAYHSDTDDAYPIVTVLGGISIVVPNFATGGCKLSEWAVYRLKENRVWTKLSHRDKMTLIQIQSDKGNGNSPH